MTRTIRLTSSQFRRLIAEEIDQATYHRKGYTRSNGTKVKAADVDYDPEKKAAAARANLVTRDYTPKSQHEGDEYMDEDDMSMGDMGGSELPVSELDEGDYMDEGALDEEEELDEKEYKAIPGMKKYMHHGKFDKSACMDDVKGKKGIKSPGGLCRSAEIALTGKARPTRGKGA